jgi:hypothetical protein
MHLSVRVGRLTKGETRTIRGKIYVLPGARGDVLTRYRSDFTRGSPRTP